MFPKKITTISKIKLWLDGSFVCKKCGNKINTLSFGYGDAICPNCYEGEDSIIFLDTDFWLNRILHKMSIKKRV